MEIKGVYKIAASREKVFAALNDQAVLQACIPGCETLDKLSDTEMTAKVRLRIGPVSAAFTGKVTLSDLDPPNGYKISGEGQGGVAGFAKGGAVVTLTEEGSDTVLAYNVDAQVGGNFHRLFGRGILRLPHYAPARKIRLHRFPQQPLARTTRRIAGLQADRLFRPHRMLRLSHRRA